jgi:DNA sulfur modification protein DndD
MLFTKLVVENFGLFRGEQVFNLRPVDPSKPIILFGGNNGTGKTSLFEAVKLCLYGNSFNGFPLSKSRYDQYLREMIHRYRGTVVQPDIASVSVQFEYVQQGQTDRYDVRRTWRRGDSRVAEVLSISKNEKVLDDIDSELWQSFVKELIPQGVSKLFFFDGEQIQDLAQHDSENTHLRDSVHSLLGLDIVERLQSDLEIRVSRQRRSMDGGAEGVIADLRKQERELSERIQGLKQNKGQLQNELDNTKAHIETQELKIAEEGGAFASKRGELKILREQLEREVSSVESEIRELCTELVPFSLTPEFCMVLRQRILEERQLRETEAARKKLNAALSKVQETIEGRGFWDGMQVSSEDRTRLVSRISKLFVENIEKPSPKSRPLHEFSVPEERRLLEWVDEALNRTPKDLRGLTLKLETLTRERQKVETDLLRIPPDEVLHPLMQEMNRLHARLGALQQEERRSDEEIKHEETKLADVVRQRDRSIESRREILNLEHKNELASKVNLVLDAYKRQLKDAKISILCQNLLDCLNQLSSKRIFEKVEVDPNTFGVTLYDHDGNPIPKEELSAGEKQIYAIALLWALAKASRRPLPFIVDTPLARLDSDHRSNLVENFFPSASHQVVIFSTDTEIDRAYFDELKSSLSRCYHLEYNKKEGMTDTSEGYFWRPEEMAAR